VQDLKSPKNFPPTPRSRQPQKTALVSCSWNFNSRARRQDAMKHHQRPSKILGKRRDASAAPSIENYYGDAKSLARRALTSFKAMPPQPDRASTLKSRSLWILTARSSNLLLTGIARAAASAHAFQIFRFCYCLCAAVLSKATTVPLASKLTPASLP